VHPDVGACALAFHPYLGSRLEHLDSRLQSRRACGNGRGFYPTRGGSWLAAVEPAAAVSPSVAAGVDANPVAAC
jgi:hypothetical protein